MEPALNKRGTKPGRSLHVRRIRERMAELGVGTADVARALGTNPEAFRRCLRSGSRVSLENALRISQALELELAEIVSLEPAPNVRRLSELVQKDKP